MQMLRRLQMHVCRATSLAPSPFRCVRYVSISSRIFLYECAPVCAYWATAKRSSHITRLHRLLLLMCFEYVLRWLYSERLRRIRSNDKSGREKRIRSNKHRELHNPWKLGMRIKLKGCRNHFSIWSSGAPQHYRAISCMRRLVLMFMYFRIKEKKEAR